MSKTTVEVITCDGPSCSKECRGLLLGWIQFVGITSDRHLCPVCATEENIKHQVYYNAMERLDKKRGD